MDNWEPYLERRKRCDGTSFRWLALAGFTGFVSPTQYVIDLTVVRSPKQDQIFMTCIGSFKISTRRNMLYP
jgi:hypothetical protein